MHWSPLLLLYAPFYAALIAMLAVVVRGAPRAGSVFAANDWVETVREAPAAPR